MRRTRWFLGALCLTATAVLAACGTPTGQATPTPTVPQTPTPSATPDPILVSVDQGTSTDTIHMRKLSDGAEVAKTEIPASATVEGVAGGKAIWLEGGTVLKGMDTQGQVAQIAQLPAAATGSIVFNPDASSYAWVRIDPGPNGQTHSVLYVKDKPVVDQSETAHALEPVVWTARGLVFQHAADGLGGYIPLGDVSGRTELLNPDTGERKPLTDDQCLFLDLATDGTYACRMPVKGLWGAKTIHIVNPDGSKVDINVPVVGHFQYAGAASFRPDLQTSELVIGGASGAGAGGNPPGQGERYETDVVDLQSQTMRTYGPTGLEPGDGSWAWAPGSWLVSWRPQGANGGDPGIYLIGLTGATHQLAKSGRPIGIITGSPSSGGGGGGPL